MAFPIHIKPFKPFARYTVSSLNLFLDKYR